MILHPCIQEQCWSGHCQENRRPHKIRPNPLLEVPHIMSVFHSTVAASFPGVSQTTSQGQKLSSKVWVTNDKVSSSRQITKTHWFHIGKVQPQMSPKTKPANKFNLREESSETFLSEWTCLQLLWQLFICLVVCNHNYVVVLVMNKTICMYSSNFFSTCHT